MTATNNNEKKGFFARLREGLGKTRTELSAKLGRIATMHRSIDDEVLEELEETLIGADLGVDTSLALVENLRREVDRGALKDAARLKEFLQKDISKILRGVEEPLRIEGQRPMVIMVIGVNGVGKTTTIGKLAHGFAAEGKTVMMAAADTFRAAAVEQLKIWGERVGCPVISQKEGADPAAVVFDAMHAAKARGTDVLLVDTAGRLHTKVPLMEELKKSKRVMGREIEGAPHEVLLVLDATTGQNAVSQVRMFNEALGVSGLIMTKLDGTARGGVTVAVAGEFKIPVRYVGVGESLEDLRPFRADDFSTALFD